jgi:hypothetical protein
MQAGHRTGGHSARSGPHPDAQIAGIGTAKRVVGKDGNAAPLEDFAKHHQRQPDRHL